ncbi:MAG: hypothetical protein ACLFOY_04150 [Desulfatibacillaceae bacterium]
MQWLRKFSADQILTMGDAVAVAEELVSNAYKMSAAQWLRNRYDVRTVADLDVDEVADRPLAQIIRYRGQLPDSSLGSAAYDFYKICLQDHNILGALDDSPDLRLFPCALYIMCHELIHIVRFARFLQRFEATDEERLAEEGRVHEKTRAILKGVRVPGMEAVLESYGDWTEPMDTRRAVYQAHQLLA